MLHLVIPNMELYSEYDNEFIYIDKQELLLEHSLLSISKWESIWEKPYFSETYSKTEEELIDYIRCMTINKDVDPLIYKYMPKHFRAIIDSYINKKCTATTIYRPSSNGKKNSEGITSELIYYWMSSFNIPYSAEEWHINRLLTLIEIFSVKNEANKKMSKEEEMRQRSALNAERRRRLKSSG